MAATMSVSRAQSRLISPWVRFRSVMTAASSSAVRAVAPLKAWSVTMLVKRSL